MKLTARVRVVEDVEFACEIPELKLKRRGGPRPVEDAENEPEVLKARGRAAKAAEQLARERFPDAVEVVVEEVREA